MKHTTALIALVGLTGAVRIPRPASIKTNANNNWNNNAGGTFLGNVAGGVASGGILLGVEQVLNQNDQKGTEQNVNAAQAPQKRDPRLRMKPSRKRLSRRPASAPAAPKAENGGGGIGGFAKDVAANVVSDTIINRIEDVVDVVQGGAAGGGQDEATGDVQGEAAGGGQEAVVDGGQEGAPAQKRDLRGKSKPSLVHPSPASPSSAPEKRDLLDLSALAKLLEATTLLPGEDSELVLEDGTDDTAGAVVQKRNTQDELDDDVNLELIEARDPRFGRGRKPSRGGAGGRGGTEPSGGLSIGSSIGNFAGNVAGNVAAGGILLGVEKAINGGGQASVEITPPSAEASEQAVAK
ncbi:hypothetical protein B0T21DRAFT_416605 [Apiosordaria backusii]|uniref:Uncharacterized protein n=1 Tax=Apiosordaria backusii TaxID=314023 RepID=A0AA39ZVF1_9PEZI|nr:hypothetical protein B0T21DRAFT_416605 [Apiosordaria backusii]